MNEDTIADFKQFIAATIRQEISGVTEDISGIRADIARLDKKIDTRTAEILGAIAETTDSRFEVVEQDVSNLQTRVTQLEAAK